jgi:hypothetical protein
MSENRRIYDKECALFVNLLISLAFSSINNARVFIPIFRIFH